MTLEKMGEKMPPTIALLAVAAFLLLAFLLLLSNRGKTSPTQSALRDLAAQTGGTYQRKSVGFGQVVEFEQGGHRFVFETTGSLAGSGDAIASYQSLRAFVSYQPVQPFELTLDPKNVREITLTLKPSDVSQVILGIPAIDDGYSVRASDSQIAAALLNDAAVQRQLATAAARTSRLAIGPHDGNAWVAFGEEEEALTGERLLAIRDLLTALLAALEHDGLAAPAL